MSKNYWIKYAFLATGILLLFILPQNVFHSPDNSVCLHRKILGIQCPLCGMTRAAYEFVHLGFGKAMRFNPVIVLIFIYFITDIVNTIFPGQKTQQIRKYLLILTIVSLILLYIVRIINHFRP